MAEQPRPPQEQQGTDEHLRRSEELGHEPLETSAAGVTVAAVGLLLIIGAAFGIVYGFFAWFSEGIEQKHLEELVEQPEEPLDLPEHRARLNPHQPRERRELRAIEDRFLRRYEWVDRDKEVARIPIGRAMELTARKELLTGDSPDGGRKQQPKAKEKRPEPDKSRGEK